MAFIIIQNLQVELNKQVILEDINLMIEKNSCVGIIGHNGSGKSMLLKAICGFVPVITGTIIIANKKVVNGETFIQDAGIIIEQPEWIPSLTAKENLELLANIQKKIEDKQIDFILEKTGLGDASDKKVRHFSLGMKQRLRIAQALMEDPEILILDEPFNGLDKKGVREITDLLIQQKKIGKTILLTSHDERTIDELCDRVIEIEKGRILCAGKH
ncbi:ABC transporter ATP-binding protein [Enterococcus lemanii]|uniref:ABC transporter ATP-binding protein n=1 Tax=Enterococcus lemanii TaxID=1159752 RepID=A0ABV9MT57_9ENTE|nr:ATP-binding cassette domain-containing protein [Enterococcus lemanii]MBM7708555.1 ABC-2 type transport system ATP-binding protein [Enterococcus lemanii]